MGKIEKGRWIIITLLAFLSCLIFGFQNSAESKENRVIDAAGRIMEISKTPKKVISLQPGLAEIFYYIGCGDNIVGRAFDYSHYTKKNWQQLQVLPDVGTLWQINVEKIVDLNPDLVITVPFFPKPAQILEKRGIPVLFLDTKTLHDIPRNIRQLGLVMDRYDIADQLATEIEKTYQGIMNKTKDIPSEKRPRIYMEGTLAGDMVSVGAETIQNQMMFWAGGRNIYGDSAIRFPLTSSEYVIGKNPDVIIVSSLASHVHGTKLEDLKKRPGWNTINAIKNNRTYIIEFCKFAWGPSVLEGLKDFAMWFHPELFGKQ